MPLVTHILESQDKPDGLWHDPVPLQDVQSEKPWHRLAILLAAQGCTVTEIAEKLERTVPWVSLLLRQPWARERLAQEINRAGRDEIETLLRANGVEALRRVFALGGEAVNESPACVSKPGQQHAFGNQRAASQVNVVSGNVKKETSKGIPLLSAAEESLAKKDV